MEKGFAGWEERGIIGSKFDKEYETAMKHYAGKLYRTLALVLVLIFVFSTPVSAAGTPSTARDMPGINKTWDVLFLGNSFSVDTSRYLYQIAEDAGYKMRIGDVWIGGLHLSEMYSYASQNQRKFTYLENTSGSWKTLKSGSSYQWRLSDVLKKRKWDAVIINQYSADTGNMGSFYKNGNVKGDNYLARVASYVHKKCPDALIGYNMTWAFPKKSTASEFSSIYDSSQKQMYKMICDTTKVLLNGYKTNEDSASAYGSQKASVKAASKGTELIDFVVPTGTAIQNARSSYMGDSLNRDQKHLTLTYGRFIAGLCAAASLGINIDNVDKLHMDAKGSSLTLKVMKQSAKDAVDHPYKVTDQKKKAPSLSDPELKLTLTKGGYVKAVWGLVKGATAYKVVYKKGGSSTLYTKTLKASDRSFLFKGVDGKNQVTVYAVGDTYISRSDKTTKTLKIK